LRRRTFTKALTIGATLAASGWSMSSLASLLDPKSVSQGLSCVDFKQIIGETFSLASHPGEKLELLELVAASNTCPDEQFYLCFQTQSGAQLEEGIHQLVDANNRKMALWLSPSQSQSKQGVMEAVVNLQTSV